MRDFNRLTNFLNSVEFQALKSKQGSMSDRDFVLAARSIWDAQINMPDVPVPAHAEWPLETMEGTSVAWDDGQYIATFEKGNYVLRDNLIDLNILLPLNKLTDIPFIVEDAQDDIEDYFVLTGVPYDDELFIFDLT
jgi:hypothetical protein